MPVSTVRRMGFAVCGVVLLGGCGVGQAPGPTPIPPDRSHGPAPTQGPGATSRTTAAPGSQPRPSFTCERVPGAAVELAVRNADSVGFVADGRAAMVRGGRTAQGYPWRVIALGGSPRPGHPDASNTVLWWGPADGDEVEPDGKLRGVFGPISRVWMGSLGVTDFVEWGREGQAAAVACPLH